MSEARLIAKKKTIREAIAAQLDAQPPMPGADFEREWKKCRDRNLETLRKLLKGA